jgi:hypothetical protein
MICPTKSACFASVLLPISGQPIDSYARIAVEATLMFDARRLAMGVVVAGAAAQGGGLLIDVLLHNGDPGRAATEGLVTFSNPGHALLIVGIGLIVIGVAIAVLGPGALRAAQTTSRGRGIAVVAAVPLCAALLFASSAAAVAHTENNRRADMTPTMRADGT